MQSTSRFNAPSRAALKPDRARALRSNSTEAERKLWWGLRDKRLQGFKFRRQQPIGPYVADFYCSAAKLIVELDGGQHGDGPQLVHDWQRTKWLAQRGYKVIRFWNTDVLSDADWVLESIAQTLQEGRQGHE